MGEQTKRYVEYTKRKIAQSIKEVKASPSINKEVVTLDKAQEYYNSLSISEKIAFDRQLKFRKARESYIEYIKLCYPSYIMTRFHRYLCRVAQEVVERVEKANLPNATLEDKKNGRLTVVISIPPQHGKSETLTKSLPSWFVGRNPDIGAMLTAYNSDLAEKFEDANRQKTAEFGNKVFGIEISDTQNNKQLYEIKGHRGFVMGAGIQGGLTGNGGGLIIVDDPYKNDIEAFSPTTRQTIRGVFNSSVQTRLRGNGTALIIIQTRWHEDDLAGQIAKEDGTIVINIPCVCEDEKTDPLGRKLGETLCPELGFDALWAEKKRKQVGEKVWNALYQGHPTIDGGEVFTRNMIKHYTKQTIPPSFEEMTISCDLSFGGKNKTNDPCAIQVWGRVGANHYLVYRYKKRLTFNEMCEKIKSVSSIYPQAIKKIVEKKANGQAVIDTLNSVIGGFVAYDPKMETKISRANSVVPLWESGNVFIPDSTIDNTIDEFEEELMKFPNSEHDDEVDAMTQYLINWNYKACGTISRENFDNFMSAWRGIKV